MTQPSENSSFALSEQLGKQLIARRWRITTAESCTGGGISAAITDVAGSSMWFAEAFVTYSNASKSECLGVAGGLIDKFGAVSEEVVLAMLDGLFCKTDAHVGIAVSGVAGPDGGTPDKPVGTVWIAWGGRDDKQSRCFQLKGGRADVRAAAVNQALRCALEWVFEQN